MALRFWSWLALLGSLGLAGCSAVSPLPNVLHLTIGTTNDLTISAELRQEIRERLVLLGKGFRQIHPDTIVQFTLDPEEEIPAAIGRRSAAGVEADLLMVNGDTAVRLLQAGLVDPFPAQPAQLALFDPEELRRLRSPHGQLAGLPLSVQPQFSCFNRRRLARPPTTLQGLLRLSAAGHPMGLPMDLDYLLWTVGSTGAMPALNRLIEGGAPNATDRRALVGWLTWLQNASSQEWVTFFPDQQSAEGELKAGRVDWIPCRSTALPHLRRAMGTALAVAPLPDGDGGQRASPVNRLRVLALGRHSSSRGRQRALAFSRYSVNPLTQRSLTLGSQIVLPANRQVTVPLQSSQVLRTMVTAAGQGQGSNRLVSLVHSNDPRIPRLQTLLTELVFGEMSPGTASDRLIQLLRPQP